MSKWGGGGLWQRRGGTLKERAPCLLSTPENISKSTKVGYTALLTSSRVAALNVKPLLDQLRKENGGGGG